MNEKPTSESIDFVARHYRRRAFSANRAWRRIVNRNTHWWNTRWAAAVAAVFALSATAATIVAYYSSRSQQAAEISPVENVLTPDVDSIRKVDFTDMPLDSVAVRIERIYGVELIGLPDENPSVTVSFEGNADDLVSLINESVGTNISIRK